MQKLINGEWVDCTEEDLLVGDTYRISVGDGGWQQQKYIEPLPEPIQIDITDISGIIYISEDLTRATVYENTTILVSGTLGIEDQNFSLPVRRNDGRLFIFLAEVIDGKFSVPINFPTCGAFAYSDNEANIDLPYRMFTVNTIRFDVLRKIPT